MRPDSPAVTRQPAALLATGRLPVGYEKAPNSNTQILRQIVRNRLAAEAPCPCTVMSLQDVLLQQSYYAIQL